MSATESTTYPETATTSATSRPGARHAAPTSRLAMARSRGMVSGPVLVLLGLWGGLIPFVGHYFGYGFTPGTTWQWTAARAWLEVLPAAVTVVGGIMISVSANRVTALLGGWLAMAAGAWFVLGPLTSPLWSPGFLGVPSGTTAGQTFVEQLGMFYGLGLVIAALAAFVTGRVSVVGVRDVAVAERRAQAAEAAGTPIDLRSGEGTVYPTETTDRTATSSPVTRQPI